MHPTAILLVFAFLALLIILGAVLTSMGVIKLRRQARVGVTTGSEAGAVPWPSMLVAAGLVLAAYGVFGVYRLIWGI